MLSAAPGSELVNACQILFSPEGSKCSVEFIKSLKPSTLKKVYRKRALETHPDRCSSSGLAGDESCEAFRKVQSAYETLKPVATGAVILPPDRPRTKHRAKGGFYTGTLPRHKLLFGQYMYYSGIITWETLIQAIVWQRQKKQLYGQIALNWHMLSPDDILHIMRNKAPGEKFGEYAKRYGYLTGFQHLAIIGRQKTDRALFGDYFIQKGLLSERQVDNLIQKAINHNNRVTTHF